MTRFRCSRGRSPRTMLSLVPPKALPTRSAGSPTEGTENTDDEIAAPFHLSPQSHTSSKSPRIQPASFRRSSPLASSLSPPPASSRPVPAFVPPCLPHFGVNPMNPTLLEAVHQGLSRSTLSLEALIIVRTLKGLIGCAFMYGILHELKKLIG